MFYLYFNLLITVFLAGCDYNHQTRYHDPTLSLQKQDYDNLTKHNNHDTKHVKHKKKKPNNNLHSSFLKPVSITSMDAIPIKEILLSIAQQTKINMVLDPSVTGCATINAHLVPAINLIVEICKTNNLRYNIDNNVLRIAHDSPYLYNYNLQFLSLTRTNKNKLSITTDVFSTMDKQTSSVDENGSNTLLTAETKMDFWSEIDQNLKTIMKCDKNSYYTINKQAGLISVYTTQKTQQQIANYLQCVQQSIDKQVLIEAKIIEVNLKDEFKSGINWDILKNHFTAKGNFGDIAPNTDATSSTAKNIFTLGYSKKKSSGLLNLLNHFGTVRTLSNPRITVLNNNSAVLKVAENLVYFKLHYTKDYKKVSGSEKIENEIHYSSDIKTVPIGLMMYVHPTVRPDGKIIMTIRPTISKIISSKQDPAVTIAAKTTLESRIPEIQIRELDSVLSMDSGETVVVGGLMEDISHNEQNGIPDTNKIPLVRNIFNSKQNSRKVTELVIFIKATIIENDNPEILYETSNIGNADQSIYNKFTSDPRAIKLEK